MKESKKWLTRGIVLLGLYICIVVIMPEVFRGLFVYIVFPQTEISNPTVTVEREIVVWRKTPEYLVTKQYTFDQENRDNLISSRFFYNKSHGTDYNSGVDSEGFFKAWVLRVGVFDDFKNADALEKQLTQSGYPAYIHSENERPGKNSYMVMIGPEVSVQNLRSWQKVLEMRLGLPSILIRYMV